MAALNKSDRVEHWLLWLCGSSAPRWDQPTRETPLPRAPRQCGHHDCTALAYPPGRYCDEHARDAIGWNKAPRAASSSRTSTRLRPTRQSLIGLPHLSPRTHTSASTGSSQVNLVVDNRGHRTGGGVIQPIYIQDRSDTPALPAPSKRCRSKKPVWVDTLQRRDASPGGEEAKHRPGGQNAKQSDQVAGRSDSGERRRPTRRTRRGNKSRADSDRTVGRHDCWTDHDLDDAPAGTTDFRCPPDDEGAATKRLLRPIGPARATTNSTPRPGGKA